MFLLRIAMHATQNVIDAKIGDKHADEGEGHVEVESTRARGRNKAGVEGDSIDYHSDKRPRLLGVPLPVAAPRYVGPYSTDEDACGEQEEGRSVDQMCESGEAAGGCLALRGLSADDECAHR